MLTNLSTLRERAKEREGSGKERWKKESARKMYRMLESNGVLSSVY
jgi:hypothetical protein